MTPLSIIKNIVQRAATGDLRHTIPIDSNNEIGEIANLFNKTIHTFKDFVIAIKEIHSTNTDLENKLISGIAETFAANSVIGGNLNSLISILEEINVNEIKNITTKGSQMLSEVVNAIAEISNGLNQINEDMMRVKENADCVFDNWEKASNRIKEGFAA